MNYSEIRKILNLSFFNFSDLGFDPLIHIIMRIPDPGSQNTGKSIK